MEISQLNENEAEIKVQDFISYVRFNEQPKYTEKDWLLAIETILDLYNNQKQRIETLQVMGKILNDRCDELKALEEEHKKENGELRKELKQEKEKNKELEVKNEWLNNQYDEMFDDLNKLDKNSISKDKIRNFIKEETKEDTYDFVAISAERLKKILED